ncbi:MAG: hypothetical protein ACREU3_03590 [Steroidobacteraceae bacterium]
MPMFRLAFALAALLLAGCASNPGIAPIGPNAYLVSRQAATGFSGLGSLKVSALREAAAYCARQGRAMQVIHTKDSKPPYIFGNYPRTEITFSCLKRGASSSSN